MLTNDSHQTLHYFLWPWKTTKGATKCSCELDHSVSADYRPSSCEPTVSLQVKQQVLTGLSWEFFLERGISSRKWRAGENIYSTSQLFQCCTKKQAWGFGLSLSTSGTGCVCFPPFWPCFFFFFHSRRGENWLSTSFSLTSRSTKFNHYLKLVFPPSETPTMNLLLEPPAGGVCLLN